MASLPFTGLPQVQENSIDRPFAPHDLRITQRDLLRSRMETRLLRFGRRNSGVKDRLFAGNTLGGLHGATGRLAVLSMEFPKGSQG